MIPSRYHLVRTYWCHTGELTPMMVLDRYARTLIPYLGNADARAEHEPAREKRASEIAVERFRRRLMSERTPAQSLRLASRLVDRDRDCARLCAIWEASGAWPLAILDHNSVSVAVNVALSSNYVAGTGGPAIGARYQPNLTKTLNSVYFFISSYTGTAASVTDLDLELRPEASAGAGTPSTATLTESKTVNPSSALGWIASTGWTSSIAALSRYFIIVGDANGGATNFANVLSRMTIPFVANLNVVLCRFNGCQTSNGWSTSSFSVQSMANMVLGFSDGTAFGCPITTATTPASSTQQRGLRITTAGLAADLKLFGVQWNTGAAAVSGIKIYTGNTAPNGAAAHTSTDQFAGGSGNTGVGFFTSGGTPYTLSAGTAYSIVATYSSATTAGPRRNDIGTGEDATLRKAMPGSGEWYWRQDDGASSWSGDLVGAVPTMGLVIDGQVAPAGGGGTSPVAQQRIIQNIGTY